MLNTNDKQNKRGNPNWEKGVSANPDGRPKGSKNKFSIAMLEEAIEAEEEEIKKHKGFTVPVFQQFVRMAYREPSVMVALMRKFVPDMQYTETKDTTPRIIRFEDADINDNGSNGNNGKKDKDILLVKGQSEED